MSNKHKHLEFIQNVVTRMAQNTFYLKGWAITIVGAFLTFFDTNKTPHFVGYLFSVILGTFWISGGYFLQQERLFRMLYDNVREKDESNIDFSMDTTRFNKDSDGIIGAMFSFSQFIFFAPLILVAMLTVCFLK